MTNSNPQRVSRSKASEYLWKQHGISRTPGTLAKLAVQGTGPRFRKAGARTVIYDTDELDRWATSILSEPVRSTSEIA
jgi:hypothetical protein